MNQSKASATTSDAQAEASFAALTGQPMQMVALGLIILFNVAGTLYWLNRNIVLVGNDASGYLVTTIEYAQFFTHLSPTTLFEAFTHPEYRTPGLFVATLPFYAAFGVHMDNAQLVNLVALVVLIWTCFELGRYAIGPGVGLMSALLVGLLPMIMAMARLFYAELWVATFAALILLALVRSQGFRHRGWSLAWGVSLGLGLLMKWSLPIYVLLPTLWVVWKSDMIEANFTSLKHIQLNGRAILLAAAGGLVGVLIWFLPNRAALQNYLLGDYHFIVWFVLGFLWLYTLQHGSSRTANIWVGLLTAAILASLWYLPHIDFLVQLAEMEQARGDAGATPLNLSTYFRYFGFFYDFHLGAVASWLIVPAAIFPWLRALWTRRPIQAHSAMLWLMLLSTYLILLFLSQSSPRFLVPALPAVAVLLAISLWQYRRTVRLTMGVVWVALLTLQWSFFTFDALSPAYARTEPAWAVRTYAMPPRSLETDLGYWIGPDILARMAATASPEVQRLGMLANSPQLHRGILKYIIGIENRTEKIQTLTESDSLGWTGMLGTQWVLLTDGENRDVEAPGLSLIKRIQEGDPLFDSLYQEEARYTLPNGDTAFLYHRAVGPGLPLDLPLQLERTKIVADFVAQASGEHATLLYADANLAVWVGIHDPAAARVHVLAGDDVLDSAYLATLTDTLIVVNDHQSTNLINWMNEHAYRTFEVGDDFASAAIYGRPRTPLIDVEVTATWPEAMLQQVRTQTTISPGQVLPIELEFALRKPSETKFAMRLMNERGEVIASHDRPLAAVDHLGLFVPPGVAAGEYALLTVLYDPITLATIPTLQGEEAAHVTTIHVAP